MTEVAPAQAALRGVCPRCGKGKMFAGWIAFAKTCADCGFDFTRFNVGDGPVVFLTLGIGALVTLLAVSVELAFEPGILIHALLWVPLTAALVILCLRFAKGLLLALEYKNAASEGRLKE
ncbi:DUF983 domain-containing protein [Sphingomonas sp. LB-2]|uniref:DUF983 domain-containing protein n=1 Tax=Sphingomonas caeni TaxID=2984949 RepID=UPI002230F750|nr:DUF983 domain-containing protein [Sphingomonas caeni]MCW3846396.1 DUF983 domain-containing protein [Sphingomonas caeni]